MLDVKELLQQLISEKNAKYRKGIYGHTQRTMAYNSNKIEGSTLTEDQTAALFEEGVIAASDDYYRAKDIEETNGHFLMFNYMLSSIDEKLSQEMIKRFHYELKSGVFEDRANGYAIGDYKKRPNEVGRFKTCLPENVPFEMEKLLAWYYEDTISLERIAEFHLRYEELHPFQDGNGRTGRMIVFRECLHNGIVPVIIKDAKRRQYIDALIAYRTERNVKPMVVLFQEEQSAYLEDCQYFFGNEIV